MKDQEGEVRVYLPTRYFGEVRTVSFNHRSHEWKGLQSPYRNGHEVRIPEQLVADTSRVKDDTRYVLESDGKLICQEEPTKPGCIALVLESPHVKEFDANFNALRPLNNKGSQRLLREGLPQLLREGEALTGVSIAGRQLALVNAIQYQCSLQHFMGSTVRGLQPCVRDTVWSTLFDAGGAEDLLARLNCLAPALVVLAPTRMVRKKLADRFGETSRPWPWLLASSHPTAWRPPVTMPQLLSLDPGERKMVMPEDPASFGPSSWLEKGSKPYICASITDFR